MQSHALWAMEDRDQKLRARPVLVNVTESTSFQRSDAKGIFKIPGECFAVSNLLEEIDHDLRNTWLDNEALWTKPIRQQVPSFIERIVEYGTKTGRAPFDGWPSINATSSISERMLDAMDVEDHEYRHCGRKMYVCDHQTNDNS